MPALPTEAVSATMCTNSQPPHVTIASDSSASSSLPAFPLPKLHSPQPSHPQSTSAAKESSSGSSVVLLSQPPVSPIQLCCTPPSVSSNFTSVSRQLPPQNPNLSRSPPPLANVSMTEVKSSLSTDRLRIHDAHGSHIPVYHQAHVLLRANGFPVSRRHRRLSGTGHYDAMLRVAQWLVKDNHNGTGNGNDNPLP